MRVIPVLDISRGQAVHARGGERAGYGPVQSVLAASADPQTLAGAFRDRLGLGELYLADLDAIAGGEPSFGLYDTLLDRGFSLMVDAGVRNRRSASRLAEAGIRSVVAGLETLEGPQQLAELGEALGASGLVLGLDLRDGLPLGDPGIWGRRDPAAIAALAFALHVRRVLVLDLMRVGGGAGPPLATAQAVRAACPGAEVFVGGGVRGRSDLEALAGLGIAGALVATALHDGSIDRRAIEAL